AAEVLAALVQVVGEVADLRVLGLAVEVLEQQLYAGTPGPVGGSLEALDAGGDGGEGGAGEVIATVHDDPLRAETPGRLDVRRQILVGRLGQQRRGFGDVDSGRRVQAQANTVALARAAHGHDALDRQLGRRVEMAGRALQAGVHVVHVVLGGP